MPVASPSARAPAGLPLHSHPPAMPAAPRSDRRRRGFAQRAALALVVSYVAASHVAACTTVRPLAGARAPVPSRVRLALTDSGAVALARYLGPGVVSITGRLDGDSAGTYVVRTSAVQTADGSEHRWDGDPVRVPRHFVANVGAVRVAPMRTAAASALVAGAFVALYAMVHGGVARSGGPSGGPNTGPR